MGSALVIASGDRDTAPSPKLLVSAVVRLEWVADPVALQRGMAVRAGDGTAVGAVAAVVLDCRSRQVTHILLGQVPPTSIYRLVPLPLVQSTGDGTVHLRATPEDIAGLPVYQPN